MKPLDLMDATLKYPSSPVVAANHAAEAGPSPEMEPRAMVSQKRREERNVLILDDDTELLDLYKKIITRLPSRPQVRIADSATRALALLESEPFELFITDLRMPKIDGFQVLLSARRRLPNLKTVVMTGAANEQYRARAYESGIDLFVEKPTTPAEIRIFSECVEALLMKGEKDQGFRGIQSKSLMDLVQIECLSQNSSVLKITSGSLEGRVWIANGTVIDAEARGMRGEEAFRYIFGWRSGNFESMPGDPERERTIFSSPESLLLDSAQTLDEAAAAGEEANADGRDREFRMLATVRGVQSLLLIREDGEKGDKWALENTEGFAVWTRRVLRDFQGVGDMLKAGPLTTVLAAGRVRGLVVLTDGRRQLFAGMDRKMSIKFIRQAARELATHLGKDLHPIWNDAAAETSFAGQSGEPTQYPCGSYTISTTGKVNVSTLPSNFPRVIMDVIGKVVLSAFTVARDLDSPLTEIAADFPGLEIRARDAEGGAIVFITPQEF
jgi:CheY-like chemotaxis protein